jgi:hypothetical protein
VNLAGELKVETLISENAKKKNEIAFSIFYFPPL